MNAWSETSADGGYWVLREGGAEIILTKRPHYCDRGHWSAIVFGINDLDWQDMFPRYYMNLDRAKLELADWLAWRLYQGRAPS